VFTNHYFNNGERNFFFEKVLDDKVGQRQVFTECGVTEMCDAFLLQGKNCNIIVYGPTSTGKTFTMQGDI
jgi:Cdc6-like AAA superfamily ATPase